MELLKCAVVVAVGLSILLSSFVVPFHQFLPAYTHWEDTYVIRPGGRASLGIGLMSGSIVQVVLFADGGGSIDFHVEDIEGKVVVDERRVSGRVLLEFQPVKTDSHVFVFENRDSSPQKMDWSIGVYYYNTTFQLAGLIMCGIGVVMIALDRTRDRAVAGQSVTTERQEKPKITYPATSLAAVEGIDLKSREKLRDAGVGSANGLAECDSVELAGKMGVSEELASVWIENAKKTLAIIKELEATEK